MSLPASYFEDLYATAPDPWSMATRWYEQRKYALTMAALPDERYGRVFEPGCSIGVLTALLAERCDELHAWDAATSAVEQTRARTAHLPHVRVEQALLPAGWPEGTADLVVLSELLYYFDEAALPGVLDRAEAALEPGGSLVAVHWRPPVPDYPLTGDRVHEVLDTRPGLARTLRHEEGHFQLEIFRRRPH